jgi:N-carbamoylputrescine amidase
MKHSKIKIGLIQTTASTHAEDNTFRQMGLIRQAAQQGAQIICLQELFNTPYFCVDYNEEAIEWAVDRHDAMFEQFSSLAAELSVVIIIPYFEKRAEGIYHNSLQVVDADGSIAGHYRKMHIPDDPGFGEKYYFTPGDAEDAWPVFETRYGKIGALICWDQWYPEAARIAALHGAQILFYPTAIGTLKKEGKAVKNKYLQAWQTIHRSHAIANGLFVAAVNRVGKESGTTFWGHSLVYGPFGEEMAMAGEKEEILYAEVDLNRIDEQRREWPFFRDRRIDAYQPILKRYIDKDE